MIETKSGDGWAYIDEVVELAQINVNDILKRVRGAYRPLGTSNLNTLSSTGKIAPKYKRGVTMGESLRINSDYLEFLLGGENGF